MRPIVLAALAASQPLHGRCGPWARTLLLGELMRCLSHDTGAILRSRFPGITYDPARTWRTLGLPTTDLASLRHGHELTPRILQGCLRLLQGCFAALSLYDRRGHRFRLVAVASADEHWSAWRSLLWRVPPELAPDPYTASCRVLVLPDDDPQHPFATLLARMTDTAVYVALGDSSATIGALHVVRPGVGSIQMEHRRLARDIGSCATAAIVPERFV